MSEEEARGLSTDDEQTGGVGVTQGEVADNDSEVAAGSTEPGVSQPPSHDKKKADSENVESAGESNSSPMGLEEKQGDDDGPVDLEEGEVPDFTTQTYTKMDLRVEKVRAQVARSLVAILVVVIFLSFITLWMITSPLTIQDLEKLLTIVFGPLVALVSGAVGYYFGGKS